MIDWLQGPCCGVALDTTHDAVLISTWYGAPTSDVVDAYFAWSDSHTAACMAAELLAVHIVDLRHAQLPSPLVRKRVAEHAGADLAAELRIATIAITSEPSFAGFVRAAGRPQPPLRQPALMIVSRIDEAIELARAQLREARIPPPAGLLPGRYRPPARLAEVG